LRFVKRSASVAGNRQPISKDRLPAVAMIGWHVASGDGEGALLFYQNGVDV